MRKLLAVSVLFILFCISLASYGAEMECLRKKINFSEGEESLSFVKSSNSKMSRSLEEEETSPSPAPSPECPQISKNTSIICQGDFAYKLGLPKDIIPEFGYLSQIDSPYVIKVLEVRPSKDEGKCFFAMKHYEATLESLKSKLLAYEATWIIYQVIQGLAVIHSKGIAHLDIALDNIYIDTRNNKLEVVIADFGCATHQTRINELNRTKPTYHPPEINGLSFYESKPVDIYGLGCVFKCLLRQDQLDGDNKPVHLWVKQIIDAMKAPVSKEAEERKKKKSVFGSTTVAIRPSITEILESFQAADCPLRNQKEINLELIKGYIKKKQQAQHKSRSAGS